MADLSAIIREAAARYNLSPDMMLRIAQIESGMNPLAANPNSSARGVYQFLTKPGGAWDQYGAGQDPLDPVANVDAGARFMRDNQATLRHKLGREPQPWEVYLTHQQGSAGGPALLSNPGRPATEVLRAFYKDPSSAITGNAGRTDMTAGDFANLWKAKYEGTAVPAGGAAATPPAGAAGLQTVPNPAALAVGPENALGSIFGSLSADLAKKPQAPLVPRQRRSVGNELGDLGAPVRLSS
jgi:hypothetical protein